MSELALKLIAENKRTKAKTLDLGRCGLTEVPEEVGEFILGSKTRLCNCSANFCSLVGIFQLLLIIQYG